MDAATLPSTFFACATFGGPRRDAMTSCRSRRTVALRYCGGTCKCRSKSCDLIGDAGSFPRSRTVILIGCYIEAPANVCVVFALCLQVINSRPITWLHTSQGADNRGNGWKIFKRPVKKKTGAKEAAGKLLEPGIASKKFFSHFHLS